MIVAPSAAWGSDANTGVRNSTVGMISRAATIDASGVRVPAASLTAVREKPPVTGKPPNSPDATFAMPRPTSSWFASMS